MNLFTKDNSKAIFLLTNHQAHKKPCQKTVFHLLVLPGFFWYNQFKIKKGVYHVRTFYLKRK